MTDDEHLIPFEDMFTDLGLAEITPPAWVIEDFIPVGLTLIGAPPKALKSTLTMAAAAVTAGMECKALPDFMRRVPETGVVMAFSYEASAGELRNMLQNEMKTKVPAIGAILVADDPWKFRLDDPDGLAQMLFWLNARHPKLVLLDPLRDFHQLEEKDSGGMNRLLRPLRQWAVTNNAGIVIVHHAKKLDGDRKTFEASDLRGTGALFGIADAVLMITPEDVGKAKLRIAATFKKAKGWDRVLTLAAYGQEVAGEELDHKDKIVLRAWKLGAREAKAIAGSTHLPRLDVEECIAKLVRNGMVVNRRKEAVDRRKR